MVQSDSCDAMHQCEVSILFGQVCVYHGNRHKSLLDFINDIMINDRPTLRNLKKWLIRIRHDQSTLPGLWWWVRFLLSLSLSFILDDVVVSGS